MAFNDESVRISVLNNSAELESNIVFLHHQPKSTGPNIFLLPMPR